MKKLNNKGFAITTLLYGLLSVAFLIMTLLMGIMSTNRQNTANLIDRVEDELNRFGESETTLGFIGEMQEYVVPYDQSGWYKIELWGAKTGTQNGDYTSGIIYLPANTMLYFYLGESCSSDCNSKFNKGNTEVRLSPTPAGGIWDDQESIRNTIMRAAGTDTTFVSGMSGMNSVKADGTLSNNTQHFSTKYFINGLRVANANDGNGKANIEIVSTNSASNPPTIKNSKLDNVRYIESCTSGTVHNGSYNKIVEIQAIDMNTGINVAKGRTGTVTTDGKFDSAESVSGTPACKKIDLNGNYSLSEIGIWYDSGSNSYEYLNHTVKVSPDDSTWYTLKNSTSTAQRETTKGQRFTKWNADPTTATFPGGNYYIFSAAGGNHVLTSQDTAGNDVVLEQFTGSKLQKWTIEPININDTYVANKSEHATKHLYKIYESQNLKALQIDEGTAEVGELAKTHQSYRGYEWDIWEIIPLDNGTYQIKSLLGTYLSTVDNSYDADSMVRLNSLESDLSNYTQRWMFVNAEY